MTVLSQLPAGATVVVIRLRSLGDTVLTTPALQLLKQARPDLRIVVVVETAYNELLHDHPHVALVLAADRTQRFWRLRTLRAIRSQQPALCLNFHGGATSVWWTLFSGARFRAGFGHFTMRFAYNVSIPRAQEILGRNTEQTVHTAEHHASAMFHLGVPITEIPRAALYAEQNPAVKPYAVFHVTAAYFTKQWATEHFREIGNFVRTHCRLDPVMIAAPGEGAVFEPLREFRCLEGPSLGELKTLLAAASLFVGNDSGPAHVAAAFGVPSVVIFGSSNSAVWRPWRTPSAVVETDWDCKPCPGDRCYAFDDPRCILSVKPSDVEAAIRGLLPEVIKKSDRHGSRLRA